MRTQLAAAVLLTFEGEGHTAYGLGNRCIDGAVEQYLLHGTLPVPGTRCTPDRAPATPRALVRDSPAVHTFARFAAGPR